MKIRFKHGARWRLTCRDVLGILIICLLLVFICYDKNFLEALNPPKAYAKADRVVSFKIVTDSSVSEDHIDNIVQSIRLASDNFENSFGIRLIYCDSEFWPNDEPSANVLTLREDVANNPCDITIAFTTRRISGNVSTIGIAAAETVIVRVHKDARLQGLTVAHEVAHLFWAVHVDKDGMIMSPELKMTENSWDELNRRIIVFNKYQNFHKYDFLRF